MPVDSNEKAGTPGFSIASTLASSSLNSNGDRLRDVALLPQYEKILKGSDPSRFSRFRNLCGDGYVGELIGGGEFNAVINIETSSTAEREAISASIGGSYMAFSGSAEFSKTVQAATSGKDVRIYSFRRGGNGTPIAITLNDISTQASQLPQLVKDSAVPLRATIYSYLTLLGDPNIDFQNFSVRESSINELADKNFQIDERISELSYIINHPKEFQTDPFDLPKLTKELAETKKIKSLLYLAANECFRNAGVCKKIDFALPNITVRPARN